MSFDGFFGQGFWQGIVGGFIVALILSGSAMAFYARIMDRAFAQKGIILSWFWLAVFFFAAIVVYSIAQPKPQPPQIVVAPMPMFPTAAQQPPSWPAALTKADIDNWSLALRPYHDKVTTVIIGFLDIGQKDFVTSLAQATSQAQWPVASLQPGVLNVGARIMASKDVLEAAQQLQQLMETKIGGNIRVDKYLEKDKAGRLIMGTIVVYAGVKPQ